VEEVLADGRTARLVTPGDFDEAASALQALQASPELQAVLAHNASNSAAQYTWEARARRLVDFLDQIQRPASAGARGMTRSVAYTQAANS
jgi:glycosyltransferase involved in cell wall biosynthesis